MGDEIQDLFQMTVGTIEELKELLAPKPPDLSNLALYESANFELTGYTESEPLQISDEDVEAEVERQLEQWRATLDPADQAILRGQGDLSAIVSQEDCKENKDVKPLIVDSNEQFQSNGRMSEDAISMDIELTAEVPKGMIVTPVTDIKTNRRAHALRSHQSDSVKRVRRSARF